LFDQIGNKKLAKVGVGFRFLVKVRSLMQRKIASAEASDDKVAKCCGQIILM
jgi:hypothetical protein